ncbi:hypothetical protein D3C78_20350 [compost metagenome]
MILSTEDIVHEIVQLDVVCGSYFNDSYVTKRNQIAEIFNHHFHANLLINFEEDGNITMSNHKQQTVAQLNADKTTLPNLFKAIKHATVLIGQLQETNQQYLVYDGETKMENGKLWVNKFAPIETIY